MDLHGWRSDGSGLDSDGEDDDDDDDDGYVDDPEGQGGHGSTLDG